MADKTSQPPQDEPESEPAWESPLDTEDLPGMDELMGFARPSPSASTSPAKGPAALDVSFVNTRDMASMDDLLAADDAPPPSRDDLPPHASPPDRQMPAVLDLTHMPGMDELLAGDRRDAAEDRTVTGRVSSKRIEGAVVDLTIGRQGFVFSGDVPDWPALQPGDEVIAVVAAAEGVHGMPRLLPRKIIPAPAAPTPTPAAKPPVNPSPAAHYVVDASNVCRSYLELRGSSSLAPLLTLVLALMQRGDSCSCVFDANERYVLRQNSSEPEGENSYEAMCREFSAIFIEAPGGADADDTILAMANREGARVISNDRYAKPGDGYREQYPWLALGGRLVRGEVADGVVVVDAIGLRAPLRRDATRMLSELRHLLREERG